MHKMAGYKDDAKTIDQLKVEEEMMMEDPVTKSEPALSTGGD